MKDDFLALVSHEVRTPLTTILGGIEFLLEGFQEHHDATEIEFMTMVQDSAHRLGSFMNDAILMANLQSRGGEKAFEEFSLQALVEMQIEKIHGPVTEREIRLENPLAGRDEVFVQGDWTLFQVAVEKLLDNAWRHNHGGGELHIDLVDRIEEAAEDGSAGEDGESDLAALMAARERSLPDLAHEWRALRVMNTGPCLEPEQIPGLFRRFELAHEIENHQRGSGLSLPIVRSIVEYHGGCVQARRIVDRGMAFYVVLSCRSSGQPRRATAPAAEGIDDVVRMARQLARDDEESVLSCGPGRG
jgi:signal transduction histidine kinase